MEAIPNSHTVALLEQERQQMIAMSEASRTLTVVARPKLASPQSAASSSAGSASSSSPSGGTAGSSTGTTVPVAAVPDPGTAKSIAYNMMSSFGWSPATYFTCLDDVWTRESNWIYDAENASGAYGIPQALPGYKMATAGADWQSNPATQIRWGLGYIQQVYGNPCAAWNFELANGYY
jgi:hypothetical protein